MSPKSKVETRVKDIRRDTRKKYSAEEKIVSCQSNSEQIA